MKKYLIILVAILLLGGGVYLFTSSNDDAMDGLADQSELSTISALLARGADIQCTYDTIDDSGNQNAGTVYFSQGRMRGMFTLTQPDKDPMMSNVINDGMTQYIWEEGSNTGFQSTVVDTDTATDSDDVKTPVDNDEEFDFNCSDWNVDEAMFTPPSDVTFDNISAELEQLNDSLDELNGAGDDLAAVCDGIEEAEARAACEAAIAR